MSENCLFCKIIKGEIPSKKIYEDDDVFAFYDIAPQAPVHFLVVPKRHIATIMDMKPEDCELVGKMLYRAQLIAKDLGDALPRTAYRERPRPRRRRRTLCVQLQS